MTKKEYIEDEGNEKSNEPVIPMNAVIDSSGLDSDFKANISKFGFEFIPDT